MNIERIKEKFQVVCDEKQRWVDVSPRKRGWVFFQSDAKTIFDAYPETSVIYLHSPERGFEDSAPGHVLLVAEYRRT